MNLICYSRKFAKAVKANWELKKKGEREQEQGQSKNRNKEGKGYEVEEIDWKET